MQLTFAVTSSFAITSTFTALIGRKSITLFDKQEEQVQIGTKILE